MVRRWEKEKTEIDCCVEVSKKALAEKEVGREAVQVRVGDGGRKKDVEPLAGGVDARGLNGSRHLRR